MQMNRIRITIVVHLLIVATACQTKLKSIEHYDNRTGEDLIELSDDKISVEIAVKSRGDSLVLNIKYKTKSLSNIYIPKGYINYKVITPELDSLLYQEIDLTPLNFTNEKYFEQSIEFITTNRFKSCSQELIIEKQSRFIAFQVNYILDKNAVSKEVATISYTNVFLSSVSTLKSGLYDSQKAKIFKLRHVAP